MANIVKFKRGASSGYSSMLSGGTAAEGEPHWVTTNSQLYVATGTTTSKWVGAEIDNGTSLGTSQTKLSTQYAIKTYIDAQVTLQDLDISADSGSNIAIDLDSEVLAVSGGEGIDTSITGNAITIAGEDASATNKGIVELATNAETNTGSDAGRVVTPAGLTAWTGDTALVTIGTIATGTWGSSATTIAVASGGTGVTSKTGSTNVVLSNSPTLVTPALGTPSALVLTNATGLPAAQVAQGTMVSGMVLVAPALGTPASGVATNITGLPIVAGTTGTLSVARGGTGATSLNDLITLTTHTTGNYVGTVAAGTGLTTTGNTSGEGIAHSLSVNTTQAITNISGNLTIGGNLVVSGDSVTTNVATIEVEDPLIKLAHGNTGSDSLDIGMYGTYEDVGGTPEYTGFFRDASDGDGVWVLFDSLTTQPGSGNNQVTVGSNNFAYAALKCADITGIDDDGSGNAEMSGFNIDGGTW